MEDVEELIYVEVEDVEDVVCLVEMATPLGGLS